MSEAQRIVALSRRALERGEQLCLATVVHVEGSAYRKPGARLLLTSGGEHAGTISGGCLEAEVSRKAWWLTASGPRVERYSSFADEDGGMPYGLGCGGTVTLLLEQGEGVRAVIDALARGTDVLEPAVLVMGLRADVPGGAGAIAVLAAAAGFEEADGSVSKAGPAQAAQAPAAVSGAAAGFGAENGVPVHAGLTTHYLRSATLPYDLAAAAWDALATGCSCLLTNEFAVCEEAISVPDGDDSAMPAYRIEYLAPPPALTIFGAGDDAQPLAELAQSLGWRVTVADGRAHLARRDRFPRANFVRVLDYADPSLRAACGIAGASPQNDAIAWTPPDAAASGKLVSDELAVILTHSYEQDRALLAALLPRDLRYLGILGPRHRTERLLAEVTPALRLSIEEGFARLHSPVGLDLGVGDPAAVALSILAEIQSVLNHRRVAITRIAAPARETLQRRPNMSRELIGELDRDLIPDLHA